MRHFWANVIGNQGVWLCAVIGAGHGLRWPAVLAATVYVLSQLAWAARPAVDLKLLGVALLCGVVVDGVAGGSGRVVYAAAGPSPWMAPVWILALWAAFAMTLTVSLKALQHRLWLAALVGLLAPLAYLSAARGWSSVAFAAPAWQGVAMLAAGWAVALPVLAACAQHWQHAAGNAAATTKGAHA
ncbi:DUF2878 family protein [uncultured Stenotrophomonas sp.]|uniref:DUF2878 family protein n=1 Tax=uncultured Stenotrophomonas sp. TaxID=165438 RepID=UPI0028D73AF5|nr:DUF2878 family protein [uncultured Stenotrophomonas sp.]